MIRGSLAMVLAVISPAGFRQAAPVGPVLERVVQRDRAVAIHPKPKPPTWLDYEKVLKGYSFLGKHMQTAMLVMGGSSLAATFAAKDIEPVLIQTGRLPGDFNRRMQETGAWMNTILDLPKSEPDFVNREYSRSVALGQFHVSVAEEVTKPLGWLPKERIPMSAQATAFVLYTFAWWPVEAMSATGEVNPSKDIEDLDAWFHLWSVIGYGMGVPEELLPRDYSTARAVVTLLRQAQYGGDLKGVPVLLGGHVRMIAGMLGVQAKRKPEEEIPAAAKALAGLISLSPGLTEALGLTGDAAAKLQSYAGDGGGASQPPKPGGG